MLEGCLLVERRIGTLPKPLAGLCLHYDRGSVNYPCESAYLGLPATRAQLGAKSTSSVPVTVLVSPTCLETMRKIYKPLTGVKVMPFYLSTSNLNSSRMLTLMGFDDSVGVKSVPSLIDHAFISARAMTILRTMGADRFNYNGKLLVIILLALFEIIVGLFVEQRMETGKVLQHRTRTKTEHLNILTITITPVKLKNRRNLIEDSRCQARATPERFDELMKVVTEERELRKKAEADPSPLNKPPTLPPP
ncbi:hypothetical protein H4Q26_015955 [Puccinia striiformis f. sp. tritici PST-130]|nr:hypothetical protein H4Q26_015955 [Puccinia striiformis f. sp. tritici PST-130]